MRLYAINKLWFKTMQRSIIISIVSEVVYGFDLHKNISALKEIENVNDRIVNKETLNVVTQNLNEYYYGCIYYFVQYIKYRKIIDYKIKVRGDLTQIEITYPKQEVLHIKEADDYSIYNEIYNRFSFNNMEMTKLDFNNWYKKFIRKQKLNKIINNI